jgi:hypothetical protein
LELDCWSARFLGGRLDLGKVVRFFLRAVCRRSARVESVGPFEGGEFDRRKAAPQAASADRLGLEQADRLLGEDIILRAGKARPWDPPRKGVNDAGRADESGSGGGSVR